MPLRDDLGTRMKENYENRAKTYLTRRMPVAIRIDGKAFHTFTRGFGKPFDHILMLTMQQTMKYLCENIQGCVLGYTQSDEITLILQDYKTLTTDAWFDYAVQKMCSISASMATMAFNRFFATNIERAVNGCLKSDCKSCSDKQKAYFDALFAAKDKGAMFDARCFNIPKEEVTNLIYWRQQDATRNSIQMAGQAYFSHNQLQGKSCAEIQDMLMLQKGINWNNYSAPEKRGSCCIKWTEIDDYDLDNIDITHRWIIDENIPIFVNEGRNYIEELINCEEE